MTQTLSIKESNSYHSHSYASTTSFKQLNLEQMNGDMNTSNTSSSAGGESLPSPFENLTYNLKHNSIYTKEIVLGKLIGFYRIGDDIGTGNFSKVKRGVHLLTKEKVAVKILDKSKLDNKTQRLLLREISSMEKLHHPNIIRLYEVIHKPTRLFICMEWAPNGELYTKINDHGKLSDNEARLIFSQVISAVDHMHSKNIIHRDIKAENIFFSSLHPLMVKIGDFGFSIGATINHQLNTYCGSPPYAAPELFRDDHYIGVYVDIWALGVLLYFIATGSMPFRADTVGKLKRIILNGDYVVPSFVSDSCQLLIRGILKPLPADRYSIKEIIESAWLDGESFSDELEPYRLNPALDTDTMKPDEQLAYERLDKLGLTRDILICTNLEKSFNTPVKGRYKHFTVENNDADSLNSNVNLNPLPIVTKDLTKFLKLNITNDFVNKIRALNVDIKQSINGTYRIIYHSLQREMRKELTTSQSKNNNLSDDNHAQNSPKSQLYNVKPANSSHNTKKFHSNERMRSPQGIASRQRLNFGSRPKLKSETYDLNKSSKSIFVKHQNSSQQPASLKNLPTLHKSFHSNNNNNNSQQQSPQMNGHSMYTKSSSQRFSSIPTHEHLYTNRNNKNNPNFESQSVYQMKGPKYGDPLLRYDTRMSVKKKSSLQGNNSIHSKSSSVSSNSNQTGNKATTRVSGSSVKQASKLCSIL